MSKGARRHIIVALLTLARRCLQLLSAFSPNSDLKTDLRVSHTRRL